MNLLFNWLEMKWPASIWQGGDNHEFVGATGRGDGVSISVGLTQDGHTGEIIRQLIRTSARGLHLKRMERSADIHRWP